MGGATTVSGARSVVARLGWGVADQGVSSISNLLLGVVVAHALSPSGFGAFALVYVAYALVLTATRGIATDPLVVRFSVGTEVGRSRAIGAATASAAAAGTVAGLACVGIGLGLGGTVGGGFIVLGCWLPFLMLQDAWRFAFFASGTPRRALVNDAVWGVLQVVLLVTLVQTGHDDVTWCLSAFGASAAAAAGFGYLQCRVRPRVREVRWWLVTHRDLGPRYFVENLSMGGARQLRFVALGALGSLTAVGATRGAEILMGPFLVILMGVSQVAVPEGAQVLSQAPRRLVQFCLGIGAVAALFAALWGAAVGLLLPSEAGRLLLGDVWPHASTLILPVALSMVAGGFVVGATAGVRALGASRRSLTAQTVSALLYAGGGCAGVAAG
ncbi:hypothetical protein E7Z54_20745, partial [Nocardioides sp.]